MKKPRPQDILIPRVFDTKVQMAQWSFQLGYKYFMDAQGWIIRIIVRKDKSLDIEETLFDINDYPILNELQKHGK